MRRGEGIYHTHASNGEPMFHRDEALHDVHHDFMRWADYLSLSHVALLGDETGTVLSLAEEEASIGGIAIARIITSFDLVGGKAV